MEDIYGYLKNTSKKIIIYGTGDGADKLYSVLASFNIKISGICCSDARYRKKEFYGFELIPLSAVRQEYGNDIIILTAFGSHDGQLMEDLRLLSGETELYIPDLPVSGDDLFTAKVYEEDKHKITLARSFLSDDFSRRVFDTVLNGKLSGKIDYFFENTIDRSLLPGEIFDGKKYKKYVDCGAYYGDTVDEFVDLMPDCERVIAIEPDKYNYRRLLKNISDERITPVNAAVGRDIGKAFFSGKKGRGSGVKSTGKDEIDIISVDSLGFIPDLIKFDVEGAEEEALNGCAEVVGYRPDIILSVYHRPRDFYELIIKAHDLLPGYRFYLRRFRCFPMWELQLYCIS